MSHSLGAFLHNIQQNCIGPNQDLDQDMSKEDLRFVAWMMFSYIEDDKSVLELLI